MNPKAIKLRGIFSDGKISPTRITDTKVIMPGRNIFSGGCNGNVQVVLDIS
jgi:hypothetical protein